MRLSYEPRPSATSARLRAAEQEIWSMPTPDDVCCGL